MPATLSIDVLVVGSGPVGLTAALALIQSGVSVRIIDKQPFQNVGQRGAGLTPRTLDAFHYLGVLSDIKAAGGPMLPMQAYSPAEGKPVREWMMIPRFDATPDVPEPNHVLLGQDSTCRILRSHLEARGVKVEASELVSLDQDQDGVTATVKHENGETETVYAKIMYGADGAKGITRKLVDAPFLGESPDIRQLIGDVELSGVDSKHWNIFGDLNQNKLMIRPAPEIENLYFIVASGKDLDIQAALSDDAVLLKFLHDVTHNPNIKLLKKHVLAEWKLNVRMVEKFTYGRVILAGDSAHCHPPAGGQGLNSGVMDAINSAWKAALVCKGLAPLSLLDTYTTERRPVIQEMLQITTGIFHGFGKTEAKTFSFDNPVALRQLGVHCRWSPVVRDELDSTAAVDSTMTEADPKESAYGSDTSDRLHAGDRAPDASALVSADGKETRLFEIFGVGQHTVLVFDHNLAKDVKAAIAELPEGIARTVIINQPAGAESGQAGDVLTDSQGNAARSYGVEKGVKVAIVRPDGVVGAVLRGAEGVQTYFAGILKAAA
ncbi:hypothetical protein PENSPDRAFT_598088 [Peniophora sp. CONT]|nr:hypothetical protein PENSPDRAFT_598088 [Peniophora sp. CONT]